MHAYACMSVWRAVIGKKASVKSMLVLLADRGAGSACGEMLQHGTAEPPNAVLYDDGFEILFLCSSCCVWAAGRVSATSPESDAKG